MIYYDQGGSPAQERLGAVIVICVTLIMMGVFSLIWFDIHTREACVAAVYATQQPTLEALNICEGVLP
jgi:hypothetical protein